VIGVYIPGGVHTIEAMKIITACGGTGGHILPGVATAQELQSRGHDVTLWLAGCNAEASSIQGWDGAVVSTPAVKLTKSFALPWRLLKALGAARGVIRRENPDVLLAMGSYTSFAPVVAARLAGVPVVLHEANAIPGRAVAKLAGMASAVGITFPAAKNYLPPDKVQLTGLPLRRAIRGVQPQQHEDFTLLVMGGSQGAHALNTIVPQAVAGIRDNRLRIIHLAGVKHAAAVEERYKELNIAAEVHAFTNDMAAIYAASDFAIARAGAATCTELAACRLPALLVPYPFAVRNHQMLNAMAMAKDGSFAVQPEDAFTPEWLTAYLQNLLYDPHKIAAMRAGIEEMEIGNLDGSKHLADLVESSAGIREGAVPPAP